MRNTVKVSASISVDLDKRLRRHIQMNYPNQHGQLSQIVSEALEIYLKSKEFGDDRLSLGYRQSKTTEVKKVD